MEDIIYNLSFLTPYFIVFPILAVLLIIAPIFIFKREVTNDNIAIYGLFINSSKKDIISFALIFLEFTAIIETLFIQKNTYYSFFFIFTPILLYGIINLDIVNMMMNVLSSSFLYALCFFERIFLSYIKNVEPIWYIIVLFAILCVVIIAFDILLLLKNINNIAKKRIRMQKKSRA